MDAPADTGALNCNGDLAILEILSFLDRLETRLRLGDPELMSRIREDAYIGLGDGGCGRHGGE